ncbi:MAG: YesL family protein [Coprococcus sp.]|nr:YesL family protein [Coprococcus sp.]
MYIFSMENPFFRFVGKVTDLVWLNILTLICALPVVTAGAAFTAMYRVLIKMAVGEEGTVTSVFFKEFKGSLKKATPVWMLAFCVLVVLLSNAYLIYQGALDKLGGLFIPAGISIGLILIFVIVFLQYFFAILSRYKTDVKNAARNAALLIFAFFPKTVCILIISFLPVVLMMTSNYFVWFWFLYGFSFSGYFIAMIIGSIFTGLEEKEEKAGA